MTEERENETTERTEQPASNQAGKQPHEQKQDAPNQSDKGKASGDQSNNQKTDAVPRR